MDQVSQQENAFMSLSDEFVFGSDEPESAESDRETTEIIFDQDGDDQGDIDFTF